MSDYSTSDLDRWEELQVNRLLFGLTSDEQTEYDALDNRLPAEQKQKADPLTTVVAAIDLAWSDAEATGLPTSLRQLVRQQASKFMANPQPTPHLSMSGNTQVRSRRGYLPWLVAAACLGLSVVTWLSQQPAGKVVREVSELRNGLVMSAKDLVQVNWSDGTTPIAGVTGDVVWSSLEQRGYMRFRGLPVNEPTKEQYQLWIFDKNQSDKTPVDGGVFDVPRMGEVIVPIQAKLKVQEVFMFAVTIEKPGGVVVSSRERLPLLAKVN